jgi:hypothetical protein
MKAVLPAQVAFMLENRLMFFDPKEHGMNVL